MLISVIITTRNEQKYIQNCLDSVKKQTYLAENVEIIVVDNNSIDGTKDIAKEYTDKIYNCGPERSAQRNLGGKQSTGKYVIYLDADMILSEEVIEECVKKCEQDNCIALYIPEKIIGEGFWIKVRDFERSFYEGTCIDAVRFIRRDKFLECGGFDEQLTGPEDWDFDRRIREVGKADIIKSPLYHNENFFNITEYLRKKNYYSRSFDGYLKKWGRDDTIIKKQLGGWYRYFGVFVEDGKWKKLLRHSVLTAGMYWLRGLVGIVFLMNKGTLKINKQE